MISTVFECIFGFCANEMDPKKLSENLFRHVYVRPNVVFNFLFDHGFNLFALEHQHTRATFFEAYRKSSVALYFAAANQNKGVNKENFKQWKKLASKDARVNHIKSFAATFKTNFPQVHSLCHVKYKAAQ